MKKDKLFFIKFPKAASVFLDSYFKKANLYDKHISRFDKHAHDHRTVSELENLDNYFKFGFVRNPWDYQVSHYHYITGGTELNKLPKKLPKNSEIIKLYPTFESYLKRDNYPRKMFFVGDDYWETTRYKYMYYKDNKFSMNYIGKVENLNDDLNYIFNLYKIKPSITIEDFETHGRVNYTNRERDYKFYYTDELADIVYQNDKFIIDKYNYKF